MRSSPGGLWALYGGGFLEPFGSTVVTPMLPEMADALHTDVPTVCLVVSGAEGAARQRPAGWQPTSAEPPTYGGSVTHHSTDSSTDIGCALAHGELPSASDGRVLVAVFDSPVAHFLVHFGRDVGFRTVFVEPEPVRVGADVHSLVDAVVSVPAADHIGPNTDVVVTDHDRYDLGPVLRDVLALPARWVGVIGSPRHTAPHVAALAALGVPEEMVAQVHRPIGLNIGSHTPAEIAVATLAGLIADRNGRPGGFVH